ASRPSGSASGSSPAVGLSSITLEKGVVTYRNWRTREEVGLSLDRFTMKRRALSAMNTLDLAGSFRGERFTLSGQIASLEAFLARRTALPMKLALATEGATATLEGMIDTDSSGPVPDVMVKVHVEETSGLAKLAGRPVTIPVPLNLTGKLTARERTYRLEGFEITSGQSKASGNLAVRLDTPRPELTAVIDSPIIDLSGLDGRERHHEKAGSVRGRRLFSDALLPFGMLRGLDGRVQLGVARLILPGKFQLESVFLQLGLRNGRLEVDPLKLVVGEGTVAGKAEVDAAPGRKPLLSARLEGSGISLERLATGAGYGQAVSGGRADLSVRFSGSGSSVQRLMSGLNGEVRLVSGPARLSGAALGLGDDVLTQLLDTVNPFRKRDRHTDLTCAVVRLPVQNGLVTIERTVAYETAKVNAVVAGTINLKTEALDLAIRPTIKEGLGMVGVPGLAELVRVTGTLAEPKIEIDTLASARAALSVGGAIATSGLSLLGEALFKKAFSDPHPCQTALKGTAGEDGAPARRPSDQQPAATRREGGVEGFLKGLRGK
ncbi:MAG TPA: AsmA-like C-terminal region-containing protein, partial [Syntrophobacteria bacterium]|nr:AsmA-like C-terminal region-containing protein [Syntrophobacteria bacterium]